MKGVSGRLPAKLRTVAFRLVQEALTNVLKHAEATAVTVTVSAVGRELHVRIEDNGRGFVPRRSRSAARPGGFGLLGMQERVELVGGRWEVQSTMHEDHHYVFQLLKAGASGYMLKRAAASGRCWP